MASMRDSFCVDRRAAKEEAKKREQQQAMIASRGMYMGAGANGAATGVGHVQPLGYGAYGEEGKCALLLADGDVRSFT